jgi:hypothetical protein
MSFFTASRSRREDTDFVNKFIHDSTINHYGFDGSGSWHKTEKSKTSYLQAVKPQG